jgi:hypothetical protein
LQGRSVVRDAIIDPEFPDTNFGSVSRDNRLKRSDVCNALLLRFNLRQLKRAPEVKVAKATASFSVWDPSSRGRTKVHAHALTTAWNEQQATWRQPSAGAKWRGNVSFRVGVDTGPMSPHVIIQPNGRQDTVDPPDQYEVDVTELVRSWLAGTIPNYGLAIVPQIDRSVDDGHFSRFQILASEYEQVRYTPKLTVVFE